MSQKSYYFPTKNTKIPAPAAELSVIFSGIISDVIRGLITYFAEIKQAVRSMIAIGDTGILHLFPRLRDFLKV